MVYGISKAGKSVGQIVVMRCENETLSCQAIDLSIKKQSKPLTNKW